MNKDRLLIFSIMLALAMIVKTTFSDDRHFTYVYESGVMGKGSRDIEIWTTPRLGKQFGYFAAIDNRLEFEIGVSKKLLTAFYINFSNTTTDNGTGVNKSSFEFRGISSEWKYQVSNPYTNAIGFALYSELGLNTDAIELETKLIFDKQIRKTKLALNLTYEPEWYLSPGKANVEHNIVGSFGTSFTISTSISAGIELRNHNIYTKDGGWESSVFFGGPVFCYLQPNWFATLTILPQLTAFKGKSAGSNLSLHDFEKFESRLIFSFHI